MQRLLLFLLACFAVVRVNAQSLTISGKVLSARDQSALPGANIVLHRITYDSKTGVATGTDGTFRFTNVAPGMYTLQVNYLGFKQLEKKVLVQKEAVNVGTLELEEATTTIQEVQVIGRVPLGEQKGDTTSFNAGAFKTAPDASAEDLVQKMPGITIQNGTIQAQGQEVKQVLVDGKRFFGEDPSTALRNLPAGVIASIEILDKESDQAELTGVNDGNESKTINIVTKPDRRNGVFGKASAGYGTDERYMLGASLNFFQGDRRVTVTGLLNNINMLDFSVGETPGGGMRGRRPPFGGGTTTGLISTNSLGLNYSDKWSDKIEVSGSYNFTERDIQNDQYRVQQYVLAADSGRTYSENNLSSIRTADHQFNFRLDYNINKRNRLLITPSISVQQRETSESIEASTANNNGLINEMLNNTAADNDTYTFRNNLYFSLKFGRLGRTISTSLNTSINGTDEENAIRANTFYYRGSSNNLDQDQQVRLDRSGFTWSGDVTYTEPLSRYGQLQLQYTIGNLANSSDRRTYTVLNESQSYTLLDTTLSNRFESDFMTQRFSSGYQYMNGNLRVRVGAGYHVARLEKEQEFPEASTFSKTFANLLPAAQMDYKLSATSNFDFNYSTNINAPAVDQLQEVVDNNNLLQLTQGNAALQPSYQHTFRTGLRNFNPETNQVFFVGLFGNITQNYIGNSLIRADSDGIVLEDGLVLEAGQQLVRPVNLNGYWDLRSVFHFGRPVNFLSSNLGLHGTIGYTRKPGLANGELSYVSSPNLGLGLTLSSNISEKVDFSISSNSNYNIVKNSLQPELDNNYFNQSSNLKLNWIFWKGLVYRTELNHQAYAGLSEGYDNSYLLWNMSISKKLFKNQQGEISLSVNDLLQQNVSVQRNLAAQYVEDVQSSALQRYFMLTFTYNLHNFNGGQTPQQDRSLPEPPPGGSPGGGPAEFPKD